MAGVTYQSSTFASRKSITATGLPPGLTVNATTGLISGTPLVVGTYAVTLTATDPGGLATSQSFNWAAVAAPNHAPVTVEYA